MIARPKMSQNEWKTTEIRGFKKLELPHPFPAQVADKLHGECTSEVMDFRFSGDLCDALDTCYNVLHRKFKGGRDKPPSMWRPWRNIAAPALLEKRATIDPLQNNYDGRNYITE